MTPQVRVVHGAPDDVELAALVAGIAAGFAPRAGRPDEAAHAARRRAAAARRRWRDGAVGPSGAGTPLRPGPDAWRWSSGA